MCHMCILKTDEPLGPLRPFYTDLSVYIPLYRDTEGHQISYLFLPALI